MNIEDFTGLIITLIVMALYFLSTRKEVMAEEEKKPLPKQAPPKVKIPPLPPQKEVVAPGIKKEAFVEALPQEPRIKTLFKQLKRKKDIVLYYEIFKRRE